MGLDRSALYPVGAMKDYEAKFWLPFKGTGKPMYAIPADLVAGDRRVGRIVSSPSMPEVRSAEAT
jgi:hypothetical protein